MLSVSASLSHCAALGMTGACARYSSLSRPVNRVHVSLRLPARSFFSSSSVDPITKQLLFNVPRVQPNFGINMIKQGHKAVVERFGRFHSEEDAGLLFAIPFVDTITLVDTRELALQIPDQSSITKDNVRVDIAGTVFLKVVDAKAACYGAERPLYACMQHCMSAMRSVVGTMELDDIFHDRSTINRKVLEAVAAGALKWGIELLRYELTNITPDASIMRAMDLQAAAERERRQTVKNATAQKEATILLSEASMLQDQNVSDGVRMKLINEAAGNKARVIAEAEGEAARIRQTAEASAEAIKTMATALAGTHGEEAARIDLARRYLEWLGALGKEKDKGSTHTVIVPANISDVAGTMAAALAMLKSPAPVSGPDSTLPPKRSAKKELPVDGETP